jgi:hypothetical protein
MSDARNQNVTDSIRLNELIELMRNEKIIDPVTNRSKPAYSVDLRHRWY